MRHGGVSATSGSSRSRLELAELRITGGELGGRRIRAPKGSKVRPTTERVREAVFSILGDVSGARVLDLFCGTGALAIEALSRGAAEATLVDTHPAAARKNLEALELTDRAETVRADVARFLRRAGEGSYDLVLCDPPYRLADRLTSELDLLVRRALAAGGRVMIESSPDNPLQMTLPLSTERAYGDTMIRIYRDER
jgi:16S rRNA (guanine966-N2)-methyltransferase